MKVIELILEIVGWLETVIGVTLGIGLIAFLIYLKWSTGTGKIIAIVLASLGFILGCAWATAIWKKHRT